MTARVAYRLYSVQISLAREFQYVWRYLTIRLHNFRHDKPSCDGQGEAKVLEYARLRSLILFAAYELSILLTRLPTRCFCRSIGSYQNRDKYRCVRNPTICNSIFVFSLTWPLANHPPPYYSRYPHYY